MKKIYEGLLENDLDGLVSNVIEVDTFESKIDDNAIVVTFFVEDEEPAHDLSNFIEKGATGIIDTDVSPAPNEDGKYLVFIEYERNNKFIKNLIDLIKSISLLTNISKNNWLFIPYKKNKAYKLDKKHVKHLINLSNASTRPDNFEEEATILNSLF